MSVHNDPKLYAKMAVPFASKEDELRAIAAFQDAVSRLRKKHKITHALLVTATSHAVEDGEPIHSVALSSFGNSFTVAQLAAIAYAQLAQPTIDALTKPLTEGPVSPSAQGGGR